MATPRKVSTPSRSLCRQQVMQRARSYSTTPKRCSPATAKTPSKRRTPCKTPIRSSGDRFIPLRSSGSDLGLGSLRIGAEGTDDFASTSGEGVSAAQEEYTQTLKDSLLPQHGEGKILAFRHKAPEQQGAHSKHRVLYSHHSTKTRTTDKKTRRHIPQLPEKILDAPELIDDYYLNLLDWSSQSVLAIALGRSVYLWNSHTGNIQFLMESPTEESYVSSLRWIPDGTHIAIGLDSGVVQLWNAQAEKKVRSMAGHSLRVSSLSWNGRCPSTLSTGSQDSHINNHDVRIRDSLCDVLSGHEQEVCGLEWSCDGTQLASGGNDNLLNIWDVNRYQAPRHRISRHTAAVKALAWCPHRPHLLASGGGTADRHIRFWNTQNGKCVKEVDTRSQVCAIKWSTTYKDEIITSHGYSQNQLALWQYPKMSKITELNGHSARVLHLAMSPDGETVASAAGDETLRFWKVFERTGCLNGMGDRTSSRVKKSASPAGKTKRSIREVNLR